MLAMAYAAVLLPVVMAKMVTIQTDAARRDVAGNYIDAHDGCILVHNKTYFLYGESYRNQTLASPYPWKTVPRLNVYTSPDMLKWTLRGDPLPMVQGTLWIPNVMYHAATQKFIMWFGSGGWQTATSDDGKQLCNCAQYRVVLDQVVLHVCASVEVEF